MERIYGLEGIKNILPIWQSLLEISEWEIQTEFVAMSKIDQDATAEVEMSYPLKKAVLRFATKETYTGLFNSDHDMIPDLVHELLHLRFYTTFGETCDMSRVYYMETEVAINQIADAMGELWDDKHFYNLEYQPSTRIYSLSKINEVCREWMHRLKIHDWNVEVAFRPQIALHNYSAEIHHASLHKKALIEVASPDTYASPVFPKQDMLHILIHELLHIVLTQVFPANNEENRSEHRSGETAINGISRGFCRLYDAKETLDVDA